MDSVRWESAFAKQAGQVRVAGARRPQRRASRAMACSAAVGAGVLAAAACATTPRILESSVRSAPPVTPHVNHIGEDPAPLSPSQLTHMQRHLYYVQHTV